MVIMPLGIAVVSLLTASIATELTSASIMRNLGRHTSSRGGHIVVIGGVSKALNVITEIINNMERRNRFWDITYLYDGERHPHYLVMWSLCVVIHLIGMI